MYTSSQHQLLRMPVAQVFFRESSFLPSVPTFLQLRSLTVRFTCSCLTRHPPDVLLCYPALWCVASELRFCFTVPIGVVTPSCSIQVPLYLIQTHRKSTPLEWWKDDLNQFMIWRSWAVKSIVMNTHIRCVILGCQHHLNWGHITLWIVQEVDTSH